jgi:diguanylate cyclase (GGDEF)-like protein
MRGHADPSAHGARTLMRARKPSRRVVALVAGAASLAGIAATGATTSPILGLVALWAVLARGAVRRPVPIACAALVLLAAGDLLAGGAPPAGYLATLTVGLICLAIGRLPTGARPTSDAAADPMRHPSPVAAASPARTVADVREWCGARGAALWRLDADNSRARLVSAAGRRVPHVVGVAGTPLAWVAETGTPLPIDPAPDWADPAALLAGTKVPQEALDATPHLLTLELDRGEGVPVATLACAAAVVGAALDRDAERRAFSAEREQGERLVRALRELPRETEPAGYADRLLESAMALAGASGAALASWRGDEAEVVRTAGFDGGPAVGDRVDSPGSEIALAGRSHTPIVRHEPAPNPVPIAHGRENWRAPPFARATVPLWNGDSVCGVLAVWNSERRPLSSAGIEMLEALARLSGGHLEAVASAGALRHSAERDSLTGLLNRRGFERAFSSEIARAERYARSLAAIAIDVDHFKAVNDNFGHEAGDIVLRAVANAISNTIREADTAARIGGEEFVVLLPETGLHAAREAAERIRAAVRRLAVSDLTLPCDVRVSLGVATLPECVAVASRLLAAADEALYHAKRSGRDRVCDARQVVAAH